MESDTVLPWRIMYLALCCAERFTLRSFIKTRVTSTRKREYPVACAVCDVCRRDCKGRQRALPAELLRRARQLLGGRHFSGSAKLEQIATQKKGTHVSRYARLTTRGSVCAQCDLSARLRPEDNTRTLRAGAEALGIVWLRRLLTNEV
jgi:hypothetical protein